LSAVDPGGRPAHEGVRIAAALAAALLLVVSFAFLLADRHPRARARVAIHPAEVASNGSAGSATVDIPRLAGEVEASIAEQEKRATVRHWLAEHHELPVGDETPSAAQAPAVAGVGRVVRRWLAGYLPFEVDTLGPAGRRDLVATSTAALTRSLLGHPPLIPFTQLQHRPPQGRVLELSTTIARGGAEAWVYVEVAYGLERAGLHLTLRRRGARGWLVAVFQG
jgi:hypothetical protein